MTDAQFDKFADRVASGKLKVTQGLSLEAYGRKYGLSADRVADLKRRRAAYDQRAASVSKDGEA